MRQVRESDERRYPELTLFRTAESRHTAFEKAQREMVRGRQFFLIVISGTASGTMLVGPALEMLFARVAHTFMPPRAVTVTVVSMLAAAGSSTLAIALGRRRIRRSLRQRLIQAGIPICLSCGYDIRGQTEPRCPECGTAFDPALLNDRPQEEAE